MPYLMLYLLHAIRYGSFVCYYGGAVMITGSIQEKKGNLYAVLNIPTANGRTKQKWVSMRLKKGGG